MSYYYCATETCSERSLFLNGNCTCCGRHFCATHVGDAVVHPCNGLTPHSKREAGSSRMIRSQKRVLANLDMDLLIREAESLRPGRTCIAPADVAAKDSGVVAHGTNINIPMTFDDGHRWMARIRQKRTTDPPPEAMQMILESEAATHTVLSAFPVKVPRVWLLKNSDPLPQQQRPHYFVDFVNGAPHKPFDVIRAVEPTEMTIKVIRNIAKWFIEIEKVTFNMVGSPCFDANGDVTIGPILSRSIQTREPPFYEGPYPTAKARYVQFFDRTLDQILKGERSLPGDVLFDYLIALELKSLVMGCDELDEGPWYIKHGEDKGDHFLLNEDGVIEGVIDWDWSYTTCKAEAFVAPSGFLSRGYYHSPSNELCAYEKVLVQAYEDFGRSDLAEFVRKGKKFQRLSGVLNRAYIPVAELNALRRAFLNLPEDTLQPTSWADWTKEAAERHHGAPGLETAIELQTRLDKA